MAANGSAGFGQDPEPTSLAPDDYGLFHIQIRELDLIRISLDPAQEDRSDRPAPFLRRGGRAVSYSGYLSVGTELRPLPIGSTLDPKEGAFSWMPGPGFLGSYDFVFVERDGSGPHRLIKVKVNIGPKY